MLEHPAHKSLTELYKDLIKTHKNTVRYGQLLALLNKIDPQTHELFKDLEQKANSPFLPNSLDSITVYEEGRSLLSYIYHQYTKKLELSESRENKMLLSNYSDRLAGLHTIKEYKLWLSSLFTDFKDKADDSLLKQSAKKEIRLHISEYLQKVIRD